MPQPFYNHDETYNGSDIHIGVERNTDLVDIGGGQTLWFHTITATINGTDTGINELCTTNGIAANPTFPAGLKPIADRLPEILESLRNDIDAMDELDIIMDDLGYIGGSEPVVGFTATPGAATYVVLDWTPDADLTYQEIGQATLADYSDAYNIHTGGLSPTITEGPYTSGATMYYQMRGQRAGADFGPWVRTSCIVP